MRPRAFVLAVVCHAAVAAPARAQVPAASTAPAGPDAPVASGAPAPASDAAREEAERHYGRARVLYGRGEYRAALGELHAALALDPDGKELVYNVAFVHEKLGEIEQSAIYYRRYLDMETDAEERARVEAALRRLEGARREMQEAARRSPPPPPPPVARERARGRLDGWVWAAGGASLAAIGAGTYLGLRALGDRPGDDARTGAGTSAAALEDRAAGAHRKAVAADWAFGVGLVAGAAAAVLYFSRADDAPARSAAIARGAARSGARGGELEARLVPLVGTASPGFAASLGARF